MIITEYTTIHVRLNEDEQYRYETPTGPIMVDHLILHGYGNDTDIEQATVHGTAIKKNGDKALFNRNGTVKLTALPLDIRREIESLLER